MFLRPKSSTAIARPIRLWERLRVSPAAALLFSLRGRVLLLFVLTFAVMFIFSVFLAQQRRDEGIADAMAHVRSTSEIIAREQRDVIADAVSIISLLAEGGDPIVQAADPGCSRKLAGLLSREPRFGNIALVDRNGDLVCTAVPTAGVVNISDREYFRAALTAQDAVVGGAIYGRITGKFTLPIFKVVRGEDGVPRGGVLVALDLAWIGQHLAGGEFDAATRLGVVDARALILSRFPDPENMVGKRTPDEEFYKVLTALGGDGVAESIGIDAVPRIYSFVRFADTTAGPLTLWVGMSRQSIVGPIDEQFRKSLLILAAIAMVLCSLAWIGGEHMLLRPLEAIAEFAQKIGSGDPQARTGLMHGRDEMGQLARVLDDMADSLASTSRLLRANRALRMSSAINQTLVHAKSEQTLVGDMCRTIVEVGGLAAASVKYGDPGAGKPLERVAQWGAEPAAPGSVLELLLKVDGESIGVLVIHAVETDAFSEEQVALLTEGASDLAYGISAQRLAQAHARAQEAIAELNRGLEQRVRTRTEELEATNKELESFAYAVSHDLRAPLRSIDGFSEALLDDYRDKLDTEGQDYLHRVREAAQRMAELIDDMLKFSRTTRGVPEVSRVDLSALASSAIAELRKADPKRDVAVSIAPGVVAQGDARMLGAVVENLLGNAWKFTVRKEHAAIEFGAEEQNGELLCHVTDNGAGFDMAFAGKLFAPFQRLHRASEFPGNGIGLATVKRVIARHGGRVWAQSAIDKGAAFFFTLPIQSSKGDDHGTCSQGDAKDQQSAGPARLAVCA